MKYYAYYPADPNKLRATAAQARLAGKGIYDVSDLVAKRHQDALNETDGELRTPIANNGAIVGRDALELNRAAIWAGLQVERFCDAIERFNHESVEPMSISRLNERVAEIEEAGSVAEADCLPSESAGSNDPFTQPEPIVGPVLTPEMEEQARLDRQYELLLVNLDDAAQAAAQQLEKGPNATAVLKAWRNGNLPAYAPTAWPGLNLDKVPINGVDPSLLDIDPEDLSGIIGDPENPLSDEALEYLWLNHPEQMQEFADNWDPKDHIVPAGESPVGMEGEDAPYGWIQGPDGRWYPVQVPYDVPAGEKYSINGSGWTTLHNHMTALEAGTEMAVILPLGPPPAIGPQPVKGDQTDYWTTDANGDLVYLGGTDAPLDVLEPPPSGPYPQTGVEAGDIPEIGPNPELERFQRRGTMLDLTVLAGENMLYNQQLAANNNYAGSFIFQEAPDGTTRVVIELGQAMTDKEGNEAQQYEYGVILENGNFDTSPPR